MGKPQHHNTIKPMSVFYSIRRLCHQISDPTEIGREAIRLIHEYDNQAYREGKIYGKWEDQEVSVLTNVFVSEPDKDKAVEIAAERLNREKSSVRNKARSLGLLR